MGRITLLRSLVCAKMTGSDIGAFDLKCIAHDSHENVGKDRPCVLDFVEFERRGNLKGSCTVGQSL